MTSWEVLVLHPSFLSGVMSAVVHMRVKRALDGSSTRMGEPLEVVVQHPTPLTTLVNKGGARRYPSKVKGTRHLHLSSVAMRGDSPR